MNFIFFQEGVPPSIKPILTLIEYKPELIVGCVLLGQSENGDLPAWFVDSASADNQAAKLLNCLNDGKVLTALDIFLIVKEPNSLLQFNVLAAVDCCNLNYSGNGGSGGKKVLELLTKHNIRTYPAEFLRPTRDKKSLAEWREEMKEAFEYSFNVVAKKWLPESWDLDAVKY
ncbi:MAG: hypothetical protein WBF90_10130 [Rivularia sp. (in: cyanobacteria)]